MSQNLLTHWKQNAAAMDASLLTAPIMLQTADAQGVLDRVSGFLAAKLGYSTDEMVGRTWSDFFVLTDEDQGQRDLWSALGDQGEVVNEEYDLLRKDGSVLTVLVSAVAEWDAFGQVERAYFVLFDNTLRKQEEACQRRADRMNAIGQLAGGVAHDFNNILAAIQGNLELLQEAPNSPASDIFVSEAIEATQRAAALTRALLCYGRRAPLVPEHHDLARVVEDIAQVTRKRIAGDVVIMTDVVDEVWPAALDKDQLSHALACLMRNAQEAMPLGGTITLALSNEEVTAENAILREGYWRPGRYVRVSVQDTGIGMADGILERVFEPYFTTKTVGAGSGMGLAMVFGFVKQSNGLIDVTSTPGKGTCIDLYFPIDEAAMGALPRPTSKAHETDIVLVRGAGRQDTGVVQDLARAGYKVECVTDGDRALDVIKRGLRPKLLLSDVVMPGSIQGPLLAQKARALVPGLKVAFFTCALGEATFTETSLRSADVRFAESLHGPALVEAVSETVGATARKAELV